ncbi:nitroreductase [Agromyces protaetiae]|uniref:Putative NAD(P)H nitroreductase n=1 Tax=Agromyces protaetiae TaxID=2509455 RepID=A0A4P6FCD0_9MICO|nr:nitroreductase [Agromyces protaetiae]QAY73306.1 nitroreductase [Agromyces protaetiae]
MNEKAAGGAPVREAALARRSAPKVTDVSPDDAELRSLIAAAGRVADHASLEPWRLVALRGDARARLGDALVEAAGLEGPDAEKLRGKPLRAPLLVAVVARTQEGHPKVPVWEQDAMAAGVAHLLSLLLDEAGWGVMWRTGPHVRHDAVAAVHGLAPGEHLLGWLYVGGVPADASRDRHRPVDASRFLTTLD